VSHSTTSLTQFAATKVGEVQIPRRNSAGTVREWISIYRAAFAMTFGVQLQYRLALSIWLLGLVLTPTVSLVVWMAVAKSAGGQVGDYSAAGFAAYFLTLMVTNHLTFTWCAWDFEEQVRNGTLSGQLLRPIDPIHIYVADNLTYKIITMVVVAPATVALSYAFAPEAHVTYTNLCAASIAVVFAGSLRFLVEYTLALAAFWTTRVFAINDLYYVPLFFFSGQLVPLTLLPDWMQTVANVLPFRWMLAFPVEVAIGRAHVEDVVIGWGIQLLWISVFAIVRVTIWRLGLKTYGAVGA
jgi:ABC-2 type transport system permease protein